LKAKVVGRKLWDKLQFFSNFNFCFAFSETPICVTAHTDLVSQTYSCLGVDLRNVEELKEKFLNAQMDYR
jgi:hypothetical protein